MKGDPRFHAELARLGALHDKKQEDYGTEDDPFANVRSSIRFGVEPWRGALVRMGDKVTRLEQYAHRGTLSNESFEDSLDDLAVYAIICKILHREVTNGESAQGEGDEGGDRVTRTPRSPNWTQVPPHGEW